MNPLLAILRQHPGILQRIVLALVLWVISLEKVNALLQGQLQSAQLPIGIIVAVAMVEATIGAMLFAGNLWRLASWAAAILGIAFAITTLVLPTVGIDPAQCGCFGSHYLSAEAHQVLSLGIAFVALSCVRAAIAPMREAM